MIILRDPVQLTGVTNPAIRKLVALRFRQLNSPDALAAPDAEFIVVEGGDAVSEIEAAIGLPILHGLLDDLPFGHPNFTPCFDILEEHINGNTRIYEMVAISNDDGAATAIFIPDTEGVDNDLLALCRSWATPAVISS
jgi:hypothetical protein